MCVWIQRYDWISDIPDAPSADDNVMRGYNVNCLIFLSSGSWINYNTADVFITVFIIAIAVSFSRKAKMIPFCSVHRVMCTIKLDNFPLAI